MQLSIDNLSKPSSKKWKLIADVILYSLPLYIGAVMALPISDTWKVWLNFGVTIITISIKAVSKFTAEETNNTTNDLQNIQ
jgi:hypothetical protein